MPAHADSSWLCLHRELWSRVLAAGQAVKDVPKGAHLSVVLLVFTHTDL